MIPKSGNWFSDKIMRKEKMADMRKDRFDRMKG